jgi:hypothetical protein
MAVEHVEKCKGCGEMVEPDICWCGQSIDHGYDNHPAIPMGCNCYRDSITEQSRATNGKAGK